MIIFLSKIKSNEKLLIRIMLIISIIIFFSFGLYHLTDFISADEHYWLYDSEGDRIHQYWKAIRERDWEDTRINDKPGITLAYISGIGILFEKNPQEIVLEDGDQHKIFNPEKTKEINFLYRLPILVLSGLFSLFFFWIIKRITNNGWIALFASSGILLSPVLLGMSTIVNPDSLFWIFGAASVFSFFELLKARAKKLVFLAMLFFGLAMASKYISLIFVPFFFFMLLFYYFFEWDQWKENREKFKKDLLGFVAYYWLIILGGIAIFLLMMPAALVSFEVFYESTIGFQGMLPIFLMLFFFQAAILVDLLVFQAKGLFCLYANTQRLKKYLPPIMYLFLAGMVILVLINWMSRFRIIDLENIPYTLKRKDEFGNLPYFFRWVMEFVPVTFALTPVTLLLLLFTWIKTALWRNRHNFLIFVLSSFFVIFFAAVIQQGLLLTIRYSIILLPFSLVLSAIAAYDLTESVEKNIPEKIFSYIYPAVLTVITVIFIFSYFGNENNARGKDPIINFYNLHFTYFIILGGIILSAAYILIWKIFKWLRTHPPKHFVVWIFLAVTGIFSLWLINPFYFIYTNDFLPKKYTITGTWSYGGYEAAQYLNGLPNTRQLTVWADAYGVCEFFIGRCIRKQIVDMDKYKIDYMVDSTNGQLKPNFNHKIENKVWSLILDGRPRNYVQIFKLQK